MIDEAAVSVIPTGSVLEQNVRETSRQYTEAYLKLDQLRHVFADRRLNAEPVEFARMESAVRQAQGICADKLERKVEAENAFAENYRVEAERYEADQKEQRRKVLTASLDEVSTELRRLQAEFQQLPAQIQLAQYRHSQLLKELSTL